MREKDKDSVTVFLKFSQEFKLGLIFFNLFGM